MSKNNTVNQAAAKTIPFHKPDGRVYFFRHELIAWVRGEVVNGIAYLKNEKLMAKNNNK